MERILTVCPTQYQSDRESKKKKKMSPPSLHTHTHSNSLSIGFAYENDRSQLPSNRLDEFFSFDICFASPLFFIFLHHL